MTNNEQGSGLRPSRRSVVKGAAWAVPAVAVAAAAPSAAASPPPPPVINFGQSEFCKLPGSSTKDSCYTNGYVAFLSFVNTSTQDFYLCGINSMTINGQSLCIVGMSSGQCTSFDSQIVIAGNTTTVVAVWTSNASSSASGTLSVDISGSFVGCPSSETYPKQTGTIKGGAWPDGGNGSCTQQPTWCNTVVSNCTTKRCA